MAVHAIPGTMPLPAGHVITLTSSELRKKTPPELLDLMCSLGISADGVGDQVSTAYTRIMAHAIDVQ